MGQAGVDHSISIVISRRSSGVEHLHGKEGVTSSNLVDGSIFKYYLYNKHHDIEHKAHNALNPPEQNRNAGEAIHQ